MFERTASLLQQEFAVDLGSSTLRIATKQAGIIFEEPTYAAHEMHRAKPRLIAYGREAQQMWGRTPASITVSCPVISSAIHHPTLVALMLRKAIARATSNNLLFKPKLLLTVPHGLSPTQRAQYVRLLQQIGSRDSVIVDSLICAGFGTGLPVNEPGGTFVIDIGAGSTEIGVLTVSGFAAASRSSICGITFDRAIQQWLLENLHINIDLEMARNVKEAIGMVANPDRHRSIQIVGLNARGEGSIEVMLSSQDIYPAFTNPLTGLCAVIRSVLQKLTPAMSAEIIHNGLILTGGASKLQGLDDFLSDAFNIPVFLMDRPEHTVVNGGLYLFREQNILSWVGRYQ